MALDRSDRRHPGGGMSDLEQELTMHLERAHELGERLRRSNTAVEEQLRRTRQIAAALKTAMGEDV
jgi:hypothetical protein